MPVNWELLGPPPDIGGAIRSGMEYSRAVRQRGAQQSAFAALAKDPNDAEALANLAATGPDGMKTAWAFQDRAREERQRELRRSVFAPAGASQPSAFVSNAPPASVEAPSGVGAAPLALPAQSAPPVVSPARPGYDPGALRQLWAEDPDAAKQIMSFIQGQDKQTREAMAGKYAAAAPVYLELMRVPEEQRRAVLQSAAPYLTQAGFTPEELAAVQLDDRSLRLYGAVGAGIEHYRTVMGPEKYGEGQTAIDPFTNDPLFRTPKQGSTRVGYDAEGREFTYSTPGDPGFGLGDVPGFTAPTLSTSGGPLAPSGGGGQPRGIRNNNPGNLRASAWTKDQPGYKGADGAGYAIFDSEAAGRRAGETLLRNYLRRGYDTPAKIVGRWAPVGENTPAEVANYTAHIASRLGIGPDDPVTGDMVPKLLDAQREFENGTFRGGAAPARGANYTGGTRPGAAAKKPSETRVLNGKTYYKVDGRWYDNAEGK